jgi:hypothetical protein
MKRLGLAVLTLRLNGVRAIVRRLWCIVWSLDIVLDLFTGDAWRSFWAAVKVLRDHLESQMWDILRDESHILVGLPLFMFDITEMDALHMWGNLHSRRALAIRRGLRYYGRHARRCADRLGRSKLIWGCSILDLDKVTP